MTALRTPWQKIQHYFWLVCGVGCLFIALVFWAITDKDELVELTKNPETEVELQIQPEKVASMNHLGALMDEVHPLNLNKRTIVNANHEAEFRGTKYVNDHQRMFAIEVFRVTDELILKNFLKKQLDRKDFTYLRVAGENVPEQYVLLYGLYSSEADAKQALGGLDMGLPKSIQPKVIAMKQFESLVDNLGSDELLPNQKIREVILKNVPIPQVDEAALAAKRAQQAAERAKMSVSTTTTTITRRDEHGEVVDVHRSESAVEVPSAKPQNTQRHTVPEIEDPFN
ncbi:hypothetical protein A3K93_11170 [Acinetobacter sp. NCu2D-2]|uniref:hypothetical protein n=1 Tax=Acinetobacter sp. NCu2D-2 TaxID=1608473 RepID=UPI0007CDBB56|nr:hypothetical protein [Acinetobacter sp. NCu2D-2]ANF82694.1 hypothetical protein A3K93_11170 [Acinetobacter sp. NCu2D-2]